MPDDTARSLDGLRHGERPLEGAAILIVEDDVSVRAGLSMILTVWGCRVLEGPSVESVEQRMRTDGFQPMLIITDLHLLGSSCTATLTKISQLVARNGFVARNGLGGSVIVMSGNTSEECRHQVQTMKWPLLLKPFTPIVLRDIIVETLNAVERPSRHTHFSSLHCDPGLSDTRTGDPLNTRSAPAA